MSLVDYVYPSPLLIRRVGVEAEIPVCERLPVKSNIPNIHFVNVPNRSFVNEQRETTRSTCIYYAPAGPLV